MVQPLQELPPLDARRSGRVKGAEAAGLSGPPTTPTQKKLEIQGRENDFLAICRKRDRLELSKAVMLEELRTSLEPDNRIQEVTPKVTVGKAADPVAQLRNALGNKLYSTQIELRVP